MKKGWDKYANQKRVQQKGYLRKYRNGNPSWKAPETSSGDSIQQSWKVKEEVVELSGNPGQLTEPLIYIGEKSESLREENIIEAHLERQQGIQKSAQGRCEAEETNYGEAKGEIMKQQTAKEKKHEAKETKAYEKKEDKKESKSKKK